VVTWRGDDTVQLVVIVMVLLPLLLLPLVQ
jgi:hypothetical protein